MTRQSIKDWITNTLTDFEFLYNGKPGSICPFTSDYSLAYDGKVADFADMDTLLDYPMFNGKSLSEIADIIEY